MITLQKDRSNGFALYLNYLPNPLPEDLTLKVVNDVDGSETNIPYALHRIGNAAVFHVPMVKLTGMHNHLLLVTSNEGYVEAGYQEGYVLGSRNVEAGVIYKEKLLYV